MRSSYIQGALTGSLFGGAGAYAVGGYLWAALAMAAMGLLAFICDQRRGYLG